MELSVLIGPLVTGVITAAVSGFSVYVVMSNRMAILETKMDNVQGQLAQQNRHFEQINQCNTDIATLRTNQETYWRRYDEMRERVERVERLLYEEGN